MMGWGNAWGGQCGYGGAGLGHMGMGFGGGLSFLWPLLGLLLLLGALVLVALLVVWAARRPGTAAASTRIGDDLTPLEVARRRLASGEMTLEEYHQVRSALTT